MDITGRAGSTSEKLIEAALTLCGLCSIAVTLGILWTLGSQTIAFFGEVPLSDFFGDTEWAPLSNAPRFGIWPLLMGTLITSTIALFVAIPVGIGAAIYLSEYASPRQRRILKPALEVLAGIPTIVYGFFALVVLTPILQFVIPGLETFNALSAGIVMGFMIIPMVSSLCEDALFAIPQTLREASYGLGASKTATICRVVLPSARSGILAALLLSLGRALGETMIVTIAAGHSPQLGLNLMDSMQTMTAFIVQISMGDISTESAEYRTIFAVASTLFIFTFLINLLSQKLMHRSRVQK